MKLHGDVPEEHKKLAAELEEMERYLDSKHHLPLEMIAKGYVCLSHDWFQLGADEEGHRLLDKADDVYPGYFHTKASDHANEDSQFALVVGNVRNFLNSLLIGAL